MCMSRRVKGRRRSPQRKESSVFIALSRSARSRLPRARHREAGSPPEDARFGRPLRYPVVALPADRRRRTRRRRRCHRRTDMGSNRGRSSVRNVRAACRRAGYPPAVRQIVSKKRRPHWSPSRPASPTSPWPSPADRNEPRARHRAGSSRGQGPSLQRSRFPPVDLPRGFCVQLGAGDREPAMRARVAAALRDARDGPSLKARAYRAFMIRPASDPRMNR